MVPSGRGAGAYPQWASWTSERLLRSIVAAGSANQRGTAQQLGLVAALLDELTDPDDPAVKKNCH